jgi:hypothetical protein
MALHLTAIPLAFHRTGELEQYLGSPVEPAKSRWSYDPDTSHRLHGRRTERSVGACAA